VVPPNAAVRPKFGFGGCTGGPYIFWLSSPGTNSAWSRTSSADSRTRGPPEINRFCRSFCVLQSDPCVRLRFAGDGTHRLSIFLVSQPTRMYSVASQSSSSGCDGGSPCMPNSSLVSTMPVPKSSSHSRFTATRAVNGWSGLTSHFANVRRFMGSPAGGWGKTAGKPGGHFVALVQVIAADVDVRLARLALAKDRHSGGNCFYFACRFANHGVEFHPFGRKRSVVRRHAILPLAVAVGELRDQWRGGPLYVR